MKISLLITLLFVCSMLFTNVSGQTPVYKDQAATIEARVNDLLSKMTLEEKIDYIGGYQGFYIRPIDRLGIPAIKMSDGPVGVRNYGPTTNYPAGIEMASTWNPGLEKKVGEAFGRDARARGVNIILAPGINIYRSPMNGRNFEYFGEDPFLSGKMAAAYIQGVQSQKVVATVKHYAANNQEWDRHNVSSDIDERTLREIYLPAFEAAVKEGKVTALMTSYNLVNGVHASQNNHLINEILKGDWGFKGLVMSDWVSVYDGVGAANGGLDLEMPSAKFMNKEILMPAIKNGTVKESTIDDKVRRILTMIIQYGFYDHPQTDKNIPLDNPENSLIALQGAREGIVLLKNDQKILPLDRSKVKTIAVIGPNADDLPAGGGSSYTTPFHSVSAFAGITKLAGDMTKVVYSPGIGDSSDKTTFSNAVFYSPDEASGVVDILKAAPSEKNRGMQAEYFDNKELKGEPKVTRLDKQINFKWTKAPMEGIPQDNFSVRWKGMIKVPKAGDYEFLVRGDDGYRLYIDDKLVLDKWQDQGANTETIKVKLEPGTIHMVKLEYYQSSGDAEIRFGWRQPVKLENNEAIDLAAKSDVAIVCVGFDRNTESEGSDRTFTLPRGQEELIKAVAKVNKNVIVVLNGGGNVATANWLGDIKGLVHAWYSGQEGGTALAEILFGVQNPSGKLPASFEKRWEDNPTFNSYYDVNQSKRVAYKEGLLVGYRYYDTKNVEPLFPFGFGLSYTTFEFRNLKITPAATAMTGDQKVTVTFTVKNSGGRDGAEVAQVYVHEVAAKVERPYKELKGFEKVFLKAGETKTVTVALDRRAFSYYDVSKKAWVADPGSFEVLVGASSKDIMLKGTVVLK
jgi:beta-glucosidase